MNIKVDYPILKEISQHLLAGRMLEAQEKDYLIASLLNNPKITRAFEITSEELEGYSERLLTTTQTVFPQCYKRFKRSFTPDSLLKVLWEIWVPLALQLITHQQAMSRPLIQGILGGQGSGKTTLASALTLILKHLGYRTVSFSLDDLYKTYADRCELRLVDPRLIWRGPPGTHDVDLGLKTLKALVENTTDQAVPIPRFDKSLWQGEGDRVEPEVVTEKADFVLFEGWFVGVRPIDPTAFLQAPAPIVTESDRQFAQDMNEVLQSYLPLWNYLDRLMVLYLPNYQLSKQWRKQAEHQMIAQGRQGMTDAEIDAFVEYFWRSLHPELFIKPLIKRADLVNLVIEINPDHSPGQVYAP